jgi:spermidine/putrescine transport system permease protein
MSHRPSVLTVYTVALIVFLFAPVLTIVVFSFDRVGVGTFPIEGLTLDWYRELGDDDAIISAAVNSAMVAAACAVVTVVLGTAAAFALTRYRLRFTGGVTALLALPLMLPGLLVGIALLSFFDWISLSLSMLTVTIGHVLVTLPFVLLTMNARLAGFDPAVEEAARNLGATPLQTFRHITFPLIRASVIGSGLLVAALSLDEFIVTFFTIGADNTLPTVIWGQMRRGVSPTVNAISTLMLAATLVLMVTARRFSDVRVR